MKNSIFTNFDVLKNPIIWSLGLLLFIEIANYLFWDENYMEKLFANPGFYTLGLVIKLIIYIVVALIGRYIILKLRKPR